MPRWFFAHFILAASHAALDHQEDATNAIKSCLDISPEIYAKDLDLVPPKDADMQTM